MRNIITPDMCDDIPDEFPLENSSDPLQTSPTMPHTDPRYLSHKQEEALLYVRTNFHLRHVSKPMRIAIRNNLRLARVLRDTRRPV
jgi:hypothetical protein